MEILQWLNFAMVVLGALVTVATALAPLTKTKVDDEAAKWLQWARGAVERLSLTKGK